MKGRQWRMSWRVHVKQRDGKWGPCACCSHGRAEKPSSLQDESGKTTWSSLGSSALTGEAQRSKVKTLHPEMGIFQLLSISPKSRTECSPTQRLHSILACPAPKTFGSRPLNPAPCPQERSLVKQRPPGSRGKFLKTPVQYSRLNKTWFLSNSPWSHGIRREWS